MSDLTKCTGEGCIRKESCERFTAKASYWQSYFEKPPFTWLKDLNKGDDAQVCKYYVDVRQ